jgi:hypothetical protein
MHLDLALRVLIQSLLDQRLDEFDQVVVKRITKHGVGDNPNVLEVGRRSDTLGSVNDTVRNDKISRRDFLSQRTDGGKGDDDLDTDGLECGNVGSGGNFGRGVLMVEAVAGEEGDLRAGGESRNGDRRRRETPGLSPRFSTGDSRVCTGH